jgi:hypothetical protein
MPRVRRVRQYHQPSDFDRGRIVAFCEAGLSHWEIAFRVDDSGARVVRICQIWEEERQGIRRRPIGQPKRTTARQDRSGLRKRVGLLA